MNLIEFYINFKIFLGMKKNNGATWRLLVSLHAFPKCQVLFLTGLTFRHSCKLYQHFYFVRHLKQGRLPITQEGLKIKNW